MTMIPQELIARNAWVTWKLVRKEGVAKPTKVPFNPHLGYEIDVSNPSLWTDYGSTINGHAKDYHGHGFCVHDDDPYTFIDIDNPYARADGTEINRADGQEFIDADILARQLWSIVEEFQSYTEWSPSGKGVHIIVKGKLPYNLKRGKIEIYSRQRYMTMTGNHVAQTPTTIEHRQYALEQLAEKLGGPTAELQIHESGPVTRSDQDVIAACLNAATADKFAPLWAGDLSGYSSGSEADLALANFICYQTDNAEQAERIFRMSGHFANRDKLNGPRGDYLVNRAIQRGFDLKPQPIDFSKLRRETEFIKTELGTTTAQAEPVNNPILKQPPEGLLGGIAHFIYDAAPRPVPEIALAGALGLLAGIVGRAYNFKGNGLGQYVVCIAPSGTGKEAISSGISKLMGAVTTTIPAAVHFLGPSRISSGPALYKQFGHGQDGKSPSFVSLIPEFGHFLAALTNPRADANMQGLRSALLDVYTKSAQGQIVGSHVYSDKDKNTLAFTAPGFSFVGDTTAGTFYEAVTNDSIELGLIPRMLLLEYDGDRVPVQPTAHMAQPHPDLVMRLKSVMETALALNAKDEVIQVLATEDAEEVFTRFDKFCDEKWNRSQHEVGRAVWARAYVKAMKIAALVAVGRNWLQPVIEPRDVEYAKAFAMADAHKLLARIETGDITIGRGPDEDRHKAILRYFRAYISKEPAPSYNIPPNYWQNNAMPLSWLMTRATKNKLFAGAHKTTQELVIRTCDELCAHGTLVRLSKDETSKARIGVTGNPRGEAYVLLDVGAIRNLDDKDQ